MAYRALKPLLWGDGTIEIGDTVPADEPGRDYDSMLHFGQIAEVSEGVDPAAFEQAAADRDEAVTAREAVEKLRLDDLARAEKLEADHGVALARALQAETERDEAIAALGQVRSDMDGVVARQAELETERDDLAKQLEDATAPAPESKPAAKKPAAKK